MLQKYNKRSYHLTGIWHFICKMMNSTLYVTCLIKICELISSICYEKTGTYTIVHKLPSKITKSVI